MLYVNMCSSAATELHETFYFGHQVKTRMQLDTGKSRHGLVGTLRSIIKEEGYVDVGSREHQSPNLFPCT
jgi:hypothetical protein